MEDRQHEVIDGADGAISDVRAISHTPVLTALLLPAARAVGEHLGKSLRDKFRQAREQVKDENLRGHLERNRDTIKKGSDRAPNLDQIRMLEEWSECVEGFDPADTEIAEFWSDVLKKIIDGHTALPTILERLKSLGADEIRMLLRIYRTTRRRLLFPSYSCRGEAEHVVILSLSQKGIITKRISKMAIGRMFIMPFGILFYGGLFLVIGRYFGFEVERFAQSHPTVSIVLAVITAVLCVGGIVVALQEEGLSGYVLTSLGRALASSSGTLSMHTEDEPVPEAKSSPRQRTKRRAPRQP